MQFVRLHVGVCGPFHVASLLVSSMHKLHARGCWRGFVSAGAHRQQRHRAHPKSARARRGAVDGKPHFEPRATRGRRGRDGRVGRGGGRQEDAVDVLRMRGAVAGVMRRARCWLCAAWSCGIRWQLRRRDRNIRRAVECCGTRVSCARASIQGERAGSRSGRASRLRWRQLTRRTAGEKSGASLSRAAN